MKAFLSFAIFLALLVSCSKEAITQADFDEIINKAIKLDEDSLEIAFSSAIELSSVSESSSSQSQDTSSSEEISSPEDLSSETELSSVEFGTSSEEASSEEASSEEASSEEVASSAEELSSSSEVVASSVVQNNCTGEDWAKATSTGGVCQWGGCAKNTLVIHNNKEYKSTCYTATSPPSAKCGWSGGPDAWEEQQDCP
jgi:hypothetical protein